MNAIRTLIVDDEPLGRERIRSLLPDQQFNIVAESQNGVEAIEVLRSHLIDLVFLDIQMPEKSGFDVIEEMGPANMPAIIFVTAYDEHAIKAFEIHAFDYLLKPFSVDRFQEAVQHAKKRLNLHSQSVTDQLNALLEHIPPSQSYLERIKVRAKSKIYFISTKHIEWIESAGNYVTLHVSGKRHLLRQTMSSLEKQLNPEDFMRIHRSYIVNLNCVHHLEALDTGEYRVSLEDGTKLTMSRTYKHQLNRF